MPASVVPRIGICHAPDGAANLREIYVASQGLCEIVMLVRPAVAEAHPDLMRVAARFFECHLLPEFTEEGIASFLAPLGLRGVTTFHDDELERADALHLSLNPQARTPVEAPWDKLVQRQLLRRAGLSRVEAAQVDSAEDLSREFAALGRPAVLKPRRAAGGQGIAFLDSRDDVDRQLALRDSWDGLMLETRIEQAPHPSGTPWLGSLLSVETVTWRQQRIHLGVLDKLPVAVARHAGPHGMDAVNVQGDILPSCLPPAQRSAAEELTGRVLDVLAVGDRVTHTELLLTPDGIEVMEVNGRLAGHTSRLFRLAGGPDPVRIALGAALGHGEPPRPAALPRAAAGLFPTFARREGPVRTTLQAKELRRLPGVRSVEELAEDGDPKSANQYRLANLTVAAGTRSALDTAVGDVLKHLSYGFTDADAPDGGVPHSFALEIK